MSKPVRVFISVAGIAAFAAAAALYVNARLQGARRTPMPADFAAKLAAADVAAERIGAFQKLRGALDKNPDQAVGLLRAFIAEHPDSGEAFEARLLLAGPLARQNDTKGAIALLDLVIADPMAGRRGARARLERGRLKLPTDPAAAEADFQWVCNDGRHPDLQHVGCRELALLDVAKGKCRAAIARLTPLLKLGLPDKDAYLDALRKAIVGETRRLAESGDAQAVLTWGDEMLRKFPELASMAGEVRFHQAGALRQLGRLTEARAILERLRQRPELLGKEIDCDAELARVTEAEVAQGILRSRDAFLKAKAQGKESRASFEGDVAADTAWGKARSPLVLTGVVTVKQGATLTIDPGAEVQFVLGARLVVEGALVARGTAEQPIRFTSAAAKSPSFFDGEGILFADPSADGRCVLEHCTVEYQRVGVACAAASPAIRRCLFARNGSAGLLATEGAEPRIEDECRFEDNDGAGIRALGASPAIRRCLILKNAGDGIHLADKSKGTVEACRVGGNRGHGIACDNFASPLIQASEIAGNQGDGIRLSRFSEPTIRGSVIRGNAGAGIRCLVSSSAAIEGNLIEDNRNYPIVLEKSDGVIRGNNVVRNRPYGIHCANSASPRIEGNWIEGNTSGIVIADGSAPTITGNAILERACAINNTNTMAIQATGNYFGKVDDGGMGALIIDKGDDPTLGEVTWRPRLTEPPARPPQPKLDLPPLP